MVFTVHVKFLNMKAYLMVSSARWIGSLRDLILWLWYWLFSFSYFSVFFNWHCTCSVSCVFRFVESWESFDNSITLDLWLCSHSLVLASFYCQYSNAHTIFIWIVVAATINFSLAWVQLYTNWGWLLLISDRNLTV